MGPEGALLSAQIWNRVYGVLLPCGALLRRPGDRLTLTQEDKTKNNPPEKRLIILDQIGRTIKRYSLPQSSYEEFARLRLARVGNGYSREGTTIDEAIGPWHIANGTLWFAKEFYDGEGNTGVGGFGYFDTENLKYRIYSPQEIVDWSVTAMLGRDWDGVVGAG